MFETGGGPAVLGSVQYDSSNRRLRKRGRGEKSNEVKRHAVTYPWDEWFAKGSFVLQHGRDFECTLGGMTINIRQAARRHGLRVRIDQGWGELTVTVKE